MTKAQLCEARSILGKTQKQMALLLGTSLKAVQSFEQGWRKVPIHTERQVLFLLSSKFPSARKAEPCWVIRRCPEEVKRSCPSWEFHAGNLCWFVNGTICHGQIQTNWNKKMKLCRRCEVFQGTFKAILA